MDKNKFVSFQVEELGSIYNTTLTKKFQNRKKWHPKEDYKQIIATLPCVVDTIYVKKGDIVNIGDKLLQYEAMKMKCNIYSDIQGRVKEILVAEKEKVAKNIVMLIIDY